MTGDNRSLSVDAICGSTSPASRSGSILRRPARGRPVLLLHTAGADTRQWRFVLNDAALTEQHRFIAFDLPWHGKSLPPVGFETAEYLLTTADLHGHRTGSLRRARARQAAAGRLLDGWTHRAAACRAASGPLRPASSPSRPRISSRPGTTSTGFTVPMPMAARWARRWSRPISRPKRRRWSAGITLWMFMQSGPGVFRGDLSFYTRDDSLIGPAVGDRHPQNPCPFSVRRI